MVPFSEHHFCDMVDLDKHYAAPPQVPILNAGPDRCRLFAGNGVRVLDRQEQAIIECEETLKERPNAIWSE
jgi:hypothetical protein